MAGGLIRRIGVGSALVATVTLGCAEPAPPSLDGDALVESLPASVVPDDPGLVTAVSCPDPIPEVVAQRLECTADLGGHPITVDVDVDVEGRATVAVREPLFDLDLAADEVAGRLEGDLGRRPDVVCPGTVVVLVVGDRIACTATLEDRAIELEIELTDEAGGFTVQLGTGG